MLIKLPLISILAAMVLFTGSCSHRSKSVRIIADSTGNITAVYLSPDETEHAGITHGSVNKQLVDRWIPSPGYLVVAPQSIIVIPSPAAGRITSVRCQPGKDVRTGSVIAGLESSDFITLQEDYLDAVNQFDFLREEYTRQGDLTVENATSLKKMQIAKRDYQAAELKLYALRSQLEILGISPDSIGIDRISPDIVIKAPSSGNIASIPILRGSYVEKGEILFTMVSSKRLLARLDIPEQFAGLIKTGCYVNFWMTHDSLKSFEAKLLSIAGEIDRESHTATAYAELPTTKDIFMPGMSVNAEIKVINDTVSLINSQSIIHISSGDFVFAKQNGIYKRIPVTKGMTLGEMSEIKDFPDELTDSIVLKGADYLNSLFDSH